jgi:hypothetical protein
MVARGAFSRGIKSLYKHINDPNRIVKTMFADVENMINQKKGGYKSGLFKSIKGKERVFSRGEAPSRQPSVEGFKPAIGQPLLKPQPSNARSAMPSPLEGVEGGGVADGVIQRPVQYGRMTRRDIGGENSILTKVQNETRIPSRELSPTEIFERNLARNQSEGINRGKGLADLHRFLKNTTRQGR